MAISTKIAMAISMEEGGKGGHKVLGLPGHEHMGRRAGEHGVTLGPGLMSMGGTWGAGLVGSIVVGDLRRGEAKAAEQCMPG